MSFIKFQDFIDLAEGEKAYKQLEKVVDEFGKTAIRINKGIEESYKTLKEDLQQYADILRTFNVNQAGAAEKLAHYGSESQRVTKRIKEQREAMAALMDVADLQTRSLNEIKSAASEVKRQYEALSGASADVKAKKQALAQEYKRLTEAAKQQSTVLKSTNKVMVESANTLESWRKELNEVTKKLSSMPNAFDPVTGKLNQQNKEAANLYKTYEQLSKRVTTAEQSMGNFRRNVGNYASGFSGLSNSVNQITREFPAFANSMQTGFLAISNNLPILFDEISRTKVGLNELKAAGQPAPSLFKAIASSIFSWGTALSLGVALLTVFGEDIVEFIGNLVKGKTITAQLTDVTKKFIEIAAQEKVQLDVLYQTATNANLPLIQRKEAIEKLRDNYGNYLKNFSDEEILAGKASSAYDRLSIAILKSSKARAAQDLMVEDQKKILEIEQQVASIREQTIKKVSSASRDKKIVGAAAIEIEVGPTVEEKRKVIQKQARDTVNALRKTQAEVQKRLDLFAKTIQDNQVDPFTAEDNKGGSSSKVDKIKKEQEAIKAALDQQVQELELSLSKQLVSQEEFEIKKRDLIIKANDALIAEEEKRGKKKDLKLITEFQTAKIKAETDFNNYINKLTEENRKATEEDTKAFNKKQFEKRMAYIDFEEAERIQSVKNEQTYVLTSKEITDEQRKALEIDYQNQIDQIAIDAINKRLEVETDAYKKAALERQKQGLLNSINTRTAGYNGDLAKDTANASLKLMQDEADAYRRLQQELNKYTGQFQFQSFLKISLIQKEYDLEIALAKKKGDLAKAAQLEKEKELQLINATAEAASSVGGLITNILKDQSDRRISILEEEKNRAIEAAGNNASAREAIEKEYTRKIAQEKTKAARAEKIGALFSIALNTAAGIMTTIKTLGLPAALPFVIATGALGAIQAAVVAARPLPKYAKGRSGGKAELAVVDEVGTELIVDKHGRIREVGTDKGARVTYLQEGDKVIPHQKTIDILSEKVFNAKRATEDIQLHNTLSQRLSENRQKEAVEIMAKAIMQGGINPQQLQVVMDNAISKIPMPKQVFDERGYIRSIQRKNQIRTYLNHLDSI